MAILAMSSFIELVTGRLRGLPWPSGVLQAVGRALLTAACYGVLVWYLFGVSRLSAAPSTFVLYCLPVLFVGAPALELSKAAILHRINMEVLAQSQETTTSSRPSQGKE